jgi:putative transposase
LQHALKDLKRAYKNFFAKRADFPRFKRMGSGERFRYPDAKPFKLDQASPKMARFFLTKLGWMRLRLCREVLATLKNATVSLRAGKWRLSIQTAREVEQPVPTASTASTAIGIDMGITRFVALSDGTIFAPFNSFKKHEQHLARYQRRMSR